MGPGGQTPSIAVNWTPLPPNHYKINVDDAVFKAQKVASVGVLV